MRRKTIKKLKNQSNKIKHRRKRQKNTEPKPKVNEPLWDKSLDTKANFENLGVTYDLNKIEKISNKTITENPTAQIKIDEEMTLDQIAEINLPPGKQKPKITQDEGFVVKKLYKKYGTNFEQMVIDHKTNKFVWTENQIKNKFIAYKKKFGSLDEEFKFFKD